jgi:hypothetical protein
MFATAKSQDRVGHARPVEKAIKNIQTAYAHIFRTMGSTNFFLVHYESLMRRKEKFLEELFFHIGMPLDELVVDESFKDGNDKYYGKT